VAVIPESEMRAIVRKISRIDDAFLPIIKASPLCSIGLKKYNKSHFETLVNSILSQQLATKAADTIIKRVNELANGAPKPETLIKLSPEQLRGVGVSGAKARSIHELATAILDKKINFHKFPKLENEEISAELTQIWGIGRWTSEMFLMFHLMRPNVLPLDDLGLRNAMNKLYAKTRPLSEKRMRSIARAWHPWCTVATWYMWRSLEPVPIEK